MDEILKGLRHFIARDLVYVIGGGAVVGAFLHLFNRVPTANDSWILFALLGGVGYFIAYALQDALSLTPVLTTTRVMQPNAFVRWLYKRFTREEWSKICIDLAEARERITNEGQLARLERTITLMQVGTTGGPCMTVCGILFLSRWWIYGDSFDLAVSILGVILGTTLICLGWLKGAQHAQFIAQHGKQ
ncbi:MAG: hypothetical protein A2W21_09170 [Betaproteobacteria bacterium RBG_16_66_20]|nr:MAG: hypothetical protein A2W21_09170 [Betaproteobacteria bacterium RBG_16_66_20]